ncbi:1-acyl-sn-glycerol-3-phosphate acyltransferase [Rhodobacter sp. Har01]|uniref:lysophospholipid acyltransferase family protein n=1 Tax=Rhodobacter sp. Har01 TaxID=2883999 RepID=UPI001D071639|nr:lysophospholipid acyltransferase family protein [Rhodobacter sp. Har01]MCB6176752.1 1-acyl-sn-glycerol-3-phosphate acyltransferase [Rhodobacter sp. Har01]
MNAPVPPLRIGPAGWLRVVWKGAVLGLVTFGCLGLLLLVRLVEAPLFGPARPWTPWITQFVCRSAFVILGLRRDVRGEPMHEKGAVVANHSSWLDIFTLNASQRIYFVAKAEVADWPAIGWLARATGTVFIARKGAEAKQQQQVFEDRLRAGHQLLFFPEGTSTDAIRVLPFKSTLFQAFYTHGLDRVMHIQPVTVIYHAPPGEDPRHYGWWGDMGFAPHLLAALAAPRHGRVEVIYHPPVPVDAFPGRKELAAYCERVIRTAHSLAEA